MSWKFYGRGEQLANLEAILARRRWFFVKVTGRRLIGKTALVQEALREIGNRRPVFYVQIPDSEPAGVLSALTDALDTFAVPTGRYPRPRDLGQVPGLLEGMVRDGYVSVLDEFQYFNRKGYTGFCSQLQAAADRLAARAADVSGGLLILGSIQTEMTALLEDRSAPLYGRVTDAIDLPHLDIGSLLTLLRDHTDSTPERLLFLWTLFEGVPKFYRDCYEQQVLGAGRRDLLRRIFFESSSPLRTEADNWFLRELKGRYDTVLKTVARRPGRMHGELVQAVREASGTDDTQIGAYLKTLVERYRLIERKLPVFAADKARQSRYYMTDNFLQAWLVALANPVSALAFRPVDPLVADADQRLAEVEGRALEKLAGQLYEERSRRDVGDFPLTRRVQGYWDRKDTEIDLVAVNERDEVIRFGSCKRSPDELLSGVNVFREHVGRFLEALPEYAGWRHEWVGIAPALGAVERAVLTRHGVIPQDLTDLTAGLA